MIKREPLPYLAGLDPNDPIGIGVIGKRPPKSFNANGMFLEGVGQTSQHLLNHVRQKVLTPPASPKLRALQNPLQFGSHCLLWHSKGDSDIDFCNRRGWRIVGHRKPPGRAFYLTFRVATVARSGIESSPSSGRNR